MKTFPLLAIGYLLSSIAPPAPAADARVITESGPSGSTNILAVGIDSRDFDIVRFYCRGTNVLELRPDDLIQKDRSVLPPVVRGGSAVVTLSDTTKAVTFNRPMPDATYIVLASPSGATGISVPVASKTTNGFTINLSVAINGRVDWLAINPQ